MIISTAPREERSNSLLQAPDEHVDNFWVLGEELDINVY